MPSVAWILIVGFAAVVIEIVVGVQALGTVLERIEEKVKEIAKHLDRSAGTLEEIQNELDWRKSSSFAHELNDALLDIRKAVDEVDQSIERQSN